MAYRQIDADTFQDDTTGETFRLAGANAMEKRTATGAGLAQDLSIGERFNQATQQRLGRDYYGRTVTRPTNPDGSDLTQQFINEGKMSPVDYTGAGQIHVPKLTPLVEPTAEDYQRMGRPVPQGTAGTHTTPVPEKNAWQKFGASVKRGVDEYQAGLYGGVSAIGEAVSKDSTKALAEKDPAKLSLRDRFSNWLIRTGEKGYMRNTQEAAQNPATTSFRQALDSGSAGELMDWAAEALGSALPSMAEMIGTGLLAAATGGTGGAAIGAMRGRALVSAARRQLMAKGVAVPEAHRLAMGIIEKLPQHLARSYAARGASVGFKAGMFGSSALSQGGQTYKAVENEQGIRAPGTALVAGAAMGALDVAGFDFLLSRFLKKGIPAATAMNVVKKVAKESGIGLVGEGVTEGAQEIISTLNEEYHRPSNVPLMDRMMSEENLWRYAEAAVAGTLFGGVFSGVGAGAKGTYEVATTKSRAAAKAKEETAKAKATADAEAAKAKEEATKAETETGAAETETGAAETETGAADAELQARIAQVEGFPPSLDGEPEVDPDQVNTGEPEVDPDQIDTGEGEDGYDSTSDVDRGLADDNEAPPPAAPAPPPAAPAPPPAAPAPPPAAPAPPPAAPAPPPAAPTTPQSRRWQQPLTTLTLAEKQGYVFDTEGEALDAASRVLTPLNISTTVGARKGDRHSLTHRTTESDIFGSGTDAGKQVPIPAEIISALQLTADRVVPEVLQIGDEAREFGGMDHVASLVRQAKTAAQAQGDPKIPTILTRKVDGISSFPSLQDAYTAALDRGLKPGEFALRGFTDNKGAFKGYQAINLKGLVRDQGTDTFATSTARAQTADEYVADQAREGKDVRQALRDQGLTVTQTGPVITATPEGAPVPTAPESERQFTEEQEAQMDAFLREDTESTVPKKVFVFGSNTQGRHGKGAALYAKNKYGAKYEQAEGLQGSSYGIITKELRTDKPAITLEDIEDGVERFLGFAEEHPNTKFLLTKIGTGLAGEGKDPATREKNYAAIAAMFGTAPPNVILINEQGKEIGPASERDSWFEKPATEAAKAEAAKPEAAKPEAAKPEAAKPEAAKATEENWVPPWDDNSEAAKPATEAPAPSEQADTSTDDYTDDDYLAGQAVQFSKRKGEKPGSTPQQFKAELQKTIGKRLTRELLSRPNITVLHKVSEAPFPVAQDTAGLYLPDGRVFFFTENILPGEAFGKLVHEQGAHYGLRRMVGDEVYNGVLRELQRMVAAPEGYQSVKAAYARALQATGKDSPNLWHETLAYLAESSPRHGLIRRIVTAIKQFLLKLGIPVGRLSDQDIIGLVQLAAFREGQNAGLSEGQMASEDTAYREAQKQIEAIKPIRNADGKLLAPNGKVSKLNERQWRVVRTNAFREFFGPWDTDPGSASKLVDENGEPKVFWHGTQADFDTFSSDPKRGGLLYFAPTSEMAEEYAVGSEYVRRETTEGGSIYPVFLDARNIAGTQTKPAGYFRDVERLGSVGFMMKGKDSAWVSEGAQGVSIAVIDPTQVKSAVGNRGTFSPFDDSILRSTRTEPSTERTVAEYAYSKASDGTIEKRWGVTDGVNWHATGFKTEREAQKALDAMPKFERTTEKAVTLTEEQKQTLRTERDRLLAENAARNAKTVRPDTIENLRNPPPVEGATPQRKAPTAKPLRSDEKRLSVTELPAYRNMAPVLKQQFEATRDRIVALQKRPMTGAEEQELREQLLVDAAAEVFDKDVDALWAFVEVTKLMDKGLPAQRVVNALDELYTPAQPGEPIKPSREHLEAVRGLFGLGGETLSTLEQWRRAVDLWHQYARRETNMIDEFFPAKSDDKATAADDRQTAWDVVKRLTGQKQDSGDTAGMQIERPFETSIPLFRGQHFTQDLATYLNARLANNAIGVPESEFLAGLAAAEDKLNPDQALELRQAFGQLIDLRDAAAASPEKRAKLAIGSMMAWLGIAEEDPVPANLTGKQRQLWEDRLKDAGYLHGLTPVGQAIQQFLLEQGTPHPKSNAARFARAMAELPDQLLKRYGGKDLQALYDLHGQEMPLSNLVITFDARNNEYRITQELITGNPYEGMMAYDYRTGEIISVKRFIDQYFTGKTDAWQGQKWAAAAELTQDEARKQKLLTEWNLARTPTGQKRIEEWKARGLTFKNKFIGVTKKSLRALQDAAAFSLGQWSQAELWSPSVLIRDLKKYGGEGAWVRYHLAPEPAEGTTVEPKMKGLMSFAYRERDPGAQYGNTFDAVKAGARTSTTQFASWPQYENYLALKPGDVVRFYRDASRKEYVNVVVDEVQKVTEADAKRSLTRGEAEQSPLFADDAETLHVDAREITKLGRALGRVLGKRFSSDLDAFNEGLIGLRLEADWTLTTPLSELVDKDISGNKDFVHPYHEALIESRQKRQQGWEPGAEGRYNYTQADLEQAEAAYRGTFDGSKASHLGGLEAVRKAFADDTRLRDEFVRLFGKLWRNVNKHYEGLELYKGGDLKPINIFSNSEDPLGAALTNPTHYNPKGGTSSSRGKLTGPYRELDKGIDYGGKHYADVEQAYHALKGETDLPKSVLMVELITAKLQQYPFLVKEIAKRGGVGFLEASTHDYYGAKGYWTTAGSNGFIKALVKAYKKVTGAETLGGKADLRRAMRKAIKDHHDTYVDYQENERPVEEYRQQYGTDIGNAPPAVRDTAMAREQDAEDRLFQEINTRRDVLGEHSTKVTGAAQNQPTPQGGVTASPATQRTDAFKLVKALVDALPLQGLNIQVYNDKDIATLKERLYQRNPLFGVEFETRLEEDRLPAMVTFADNEVMIYYDSKRTDAEVIDAIGHEMGHVVLRALLDSERIRNTPLWNRILNDYRMSGSEQRFMEWFADEVKNWVTSRRKAGVTDAKTRLFKRVVDAVKRILEIIGFRPTPGAVSAYLDGLVLREKTLEQEAFLKGLQGQFYDRMTFLQTVNSTTTPILDIPMHMDFLTLDGVKKGTLDQVQALEEHFPKLKTLHRAVGDALTLVGDTFRTLNGWLRAQGSQEMTLLADMLDNLARGADQIKLYSNEELGQALTDLLAQQDTTEQRVAEAQGRPPRAQYDEAGRARLRRKLLEQANALRARDGVRGVSMVGYIDPDTGMAKITPVPVYHESFTEAVRREFQGEWGSGYRHLVFDKSEEDLKRWGQELLRNDPQSEEAKAIKAWLDQFYNDYLVPRYTGPLSTARKESVVHIGRLENWGLARMYNSDAVAANSNDFVELLMEYVPDMTLTEAWKMTHAIITGRELLDDKETSEAAGDPHTYSPGAKSKKERWLNIPIDKLLPFLEQRVDKVLDSYVHSFIKRAEWDRRFGEEVEQSTKEGGKYFWKQNYYTDIIKQGAVLNAKELDAPRRAFLKRRTADVIEAYLGRYKVFDTNPHARAVMSATQAAVNWLTMPLSALSQFPDLVGPLTRMGGNTKALMAGYRDALTAIRNKDGGLWKAAELMGVVFRDTKNMGAAAIFDQQFMTEGAQRWNDRLFKYNGMQLFSNFSRVAAYATSKYWLESLATDPAGERQLGQVGLTQKDVEEWIKGGYKEYTTGDSQNSVPFRIALARMRFVNESVFSPHAGQRPLWANHPYMMLIWHLKSFTYSFFTQILAPAFREVKNNPAMYSKMMAVLPMGLMMPLALMGMALRDEIKNDMLPWRSGLSDAERKDDFWEKTSRVISSTGILGPAQLLLDADRSASWGRSPIFALMGPTATKTEEFFRADGVLDGLMRLTPGLSMLPQERRQILNWWRNE